MPTKIHPRTHDVERAKLALAEFAFKIRESHELTLVEFSGVLVWLLAEVQRLMLRKERHPDDPGKKADEE
jgi:hypothetical protein